MVRTLKREFNPRPVLSTNIDYWIGYRGGQNSGKRVTLVFSTHCDYYIGYKGGQNSGKNICGVQEQNPCVELMFRQFRDMV